MRFTSIFKFRNRDGKGVEKGEDTRPTLKNFFKQFRRKLSHLLSLNILMLMQIVPVIVAVFAFLTTPKTPSQTSAIFAPLYGASLIEPNGATDILLATNALPLSIPVFNPSAYWVIGICALFLVLTLGWQSVGSSYVLRGLVRGDAVFVFSDYFYGIKRNFKQSFLFGLIDSLLLIVLVIDLAYYSQTVGTFWLDVMFWILTAIAILYAMMRPYIYMMLITFDMKIRKMFKNALIFAALGIKRNLMAILGILLLVVFHVTLIILFMPQGVITVILPLIYVFAAIGFITAYAIYPVIDRYMIAPYRTETLAEPVEDSEGDTM